MKEMKKKGMQFGILSQSKNIGSHHKFQNENKGVYKQRSAEIDMDKVGAGLGVWATSLASKITQQ